MSASIQIDWHCECGDGPSSHFSKPEGETCYGWCQNTDHDCAGQGYRPINHTRRVPAFEAMLKALGDFDQHGGERWPKHFTMDLSTDYKMVTTELDQGDAFIWIVREMGTHLYPLKYVPDDKVGFIRQAMQYHERQNEGARVYVWDGYGKLSRITYDMAREIVRLAGQGHVRVSDTVAA